MKWVSDSRLKRIVQELEYLLPDDFKPMEYILLHPDLIVAGIDDEQKAKEHYLLFGRKENRLYKKMVVPTVEPQGIPKAEFWNNGKNLLYFSPMTPDYDHSSGGNRLLQILKILKLDLDYNIWFLCNGTHKPEYIDILKSFDISVFLPNADKQEYLDKYLKEAKQNNINFDNAIFSWYDIAHQYMHIVKSIYPNIKIITDSVDVHWIREQRGKDSGQLAIPQKSLDFRKNIEKNIYNQSDVIFAITEKDKGYIQKEIGYGSNIRILSNIHEQKSVDLGDNMMFIGNFNHGPNIDAARSCIEIHNLFQQTELFNTLRKKPRLLIAGPHLASDIQKHILNSNYIDYLGYIPDLETLYKQSNLLISPLNWGAGIKGKICDSAMCGLAVLTSDIGNEGINFTHKTNALIANTTSEFVDQLIYFYSLTKKQRLALGIAGQNHLSQIVSVLAATNILKHTLQDKHIVISIVTYNQTEKLDTCLNQILSLTKYTNYTIYVSDNGSNYKTKNLIESKYKNYINTGKIIYQKNATNDYFIKPNNKLFQKSEYNNSDFVLVNDDIEIEDGYWLSYLYSSAYTADYIGAAGGKTIYPDGKLAEAGAVLYADGSGRNIGRNQDPNAIEYNQPKYVGYCSGCLLYMRHDAIDKIGVFSTKLEKLYYEDSDWQYRAHAHGLKTIYDPRCWAIHHEGATSGTDINAGAKKYQQINKNIFLQNMKQLKINNIELYNNE
jgi:GT2 family glycosyltransferase